MNKTKTSQMKRFRTTESFVWFGKKLTWADAHKPSYDRWIDTKILFLGSFQLELYLRFLKQVFGIALAVLSSDIALKLCCSLNGKKLGFLGNILFQPKDFQEILFLTVKWAANLWSMFNSQKLKNSILKQQSNRKEFLGHKNFNTHHINILSAL